MDVPVSKSACFVSSRDENDKQKVKNLVIQEIKIVSAHTEEIVDSADADRLYFLKQHTRLLLN